MRPSLLIMKPLPIVASNPGVNVLMRTTPRRTDFTLNFSGVWPLAKLDREMSKKLATSAVTRAVGIMERNIRGLPTVLGRIGLGESIPCRSKGENKNRSIKVEAIAASEFISRQLPIRPPQPPRKRLHAVMPLDVLPT